MFSRVVKFEWALSFSFLLLSTNSAAFAQTVIFSAITDALAGRCYNAATTAPDVTDANQLRIGIHTDADPPTRQSVACVASDDGPVLTMDTISFLASAPTGYYIAKITFSQSGSTTGSRGGAGYRGASWVVDDEALLIPSTPTGWAATVDFTGQNKTTVPVAITTFLAAAGGRVRDGAASATNPVVTVALAPIKEPPPPPPPPPPSNPVPTTMALSPPALTAGSSSFTLTVTGSNFVIGAVVRWNGQDRVTTAISSTQLRAAISAADVASAGVATVTVFNPSPGGGESGKQTFTISAPPLPNPVPTTTEIFPHTEVAGRVGFTLTVTGSDFLNSSVVRWNGAERATTFISPTQLTAAISSADIASAGTVSVTVFTPAAGFNPPPDGGVSNEQPFTITSIPPPSETLPVLTSSGNVNDGRGKEWRQLTQTRGLTYSQVATICPQDGISPCSGKIGNIDLTDWIWANSWQVTELLSQFAPDILNSPSLSGSGYVTAATQFHNVFTLTQHITGTVNLQFIDFRFVGGITATAPVDANGIPTPIGGKVTISEELFGPVASFRLGPIDAGDTLMRGIFLWRPTGFSTESVYAYKDEGISPSPYGGIALNVLKNDWVGGAEATVGNASVIPVSPVSPATQAITLRADGAVQVAAGAFAGTYSLQYNLCDKAIPSTCDPAWVSVQVHSFGLVAGNDQASASFSAGGTPIANVLANDTLGGVTADLTVVLLRQVSTTNSGINLNTSNGAIVVAAGAPSNTHTLVYEVCERANPSNCQQATVTLLVMSIEAVDDVFPKLSTKSGGVSPSVLANDRFNGAAATAENVNLSLLTSLPEGVTFNTNTGVFIVAPKSPSGSYPVMYQICEINNSTNCDYALLTLELSGSSN